jgi:hypothetical protein
MAVNACKWWAAALVAVALLVVRWATAEDVTSAADQLVSWKEYGSASVAGTTWAGTDSDGDYYEYHFRPDGSLHYTSPTGSWKDATWKQHKNRIYMEMNNKYSEYEGTIAGKRMAGDSWNVVGKKWTWEAVRK